MDRLYKVKITQHAEQSMREIAHYIAFDLLSPEAAVNLLKILNAEIGKLNFMPERIHLTPEEPWRSQGIHRMKVKNFYVYFWVDEENLKVQVTDVIYQKRNQQLLLASMPLDEE